MAKVQSIKMRVFAATIAFFSGSMIIVCLIILAKLAE